jgi:hypothetical protein
MKVYNQAKFVGGLYDEIVLHEVGVDSGGNIDVDPARNGSPAANISAVCVSASGFATVFSDNAK